NQLRRLLEYQETIDRQRIRRQCLEHLAILDLLEQGERARAAELLARHLGNASHEKVQQLQRAAHPSSLFNPTAQAKHQE
ncbi:MAG: FCD domain-containing protein, partial [Alcaligenes sp.]